MDIEKVIKETETILSRTVKSIEESKRKGSPGPDKLMGFARVLNGYLRLIQLQNPNGRKKDLLEGMSGVDCEMYGDPDYVDSLYE